MLRALDPGSELGRKVFALIDNGNFVPDELIAEMLGERIQLSDCAFGSVLDGFPRNVSQAPLLDELLSSLDRGEALFFELAVDPDVAYARCVKRPDGRADDSPEKIRHRIDLYFEQTEPLIDYYRERGQIVTLDGEEDTDSVTAAISRTILDRVQPPALHPALVRHAG
jgi:adenylate kinase